jgi:hypothetical protein
MKQRYAQDGTMPEDYFTYQIAVLEEILPEALEDERSFGGSVSDLSGIKSGKPASEGGDHMAMIADVLAALNSLTKTDRELMQRKYGDGEVTPDTVLAQYYEQSAGIVARDVKRCLRKMAKFLGSDPVHGRKAMSNAQAQHVTREQG